MTQSANGNDIVHASHVRLAYRAVLGRMPTDEEVRVQLAGVRTTGELLDVLVAAPEFTGERRVLVDPPSEHPRYVNMWSEDLAAWSHPPGSRSSDGVALVGNEGWLFIAGGSNATLAQHTGEEAMPAGWLEDWQELLEFRRAEAVRVGVTYIGVIVPDKLAILDHHLPDQPRINGLRPALRLQELEGPLLYPLDELARCKEPYLRTDSHCSLLGNAALSSTVLDAIDGPSLGPDLLSSAGERVLCGDLGIKFSPPIVEIAASVGSLGDATILEDNRDEVARHGGHIGSRRVLRHEEAPDPRTVVVFGDSYGFAAEGYEGLTWFLAQQFREVHFIWAPFGWDADYVVRHGAEVVVSQSAERFVNRVPARSISTDALIAKAVSGHGVETAAIFGDSDVGSASG